MALTRAQLLMGNDQQGAVLPGEVQAVKQGAGIFIDTDGTISVDASTVVGLVRLNNPSGAFNNYVWPGATGTTGQFLSLGTGNQLVWSNAGVFVSGSAPTNPTIGSLWFNCGTGQLLVYEACTSGAPKWTSGSEGFPVNPGSTVITPAPASGAGTSADPYVLSSTSTGAGGTTVVATVTVNDLAPFQFVSIVDLDAFANGGRFSFTNNVANAAGVLQFDILFNDQPASAAGTSYTCELKIGYGTVYIEASVSLTQGFIITDPGVITGSPIVGSTLTYSGGTTSGGVPPVTTSWVWKEVNSDTVIQQGGNNYTTTASEFGDALFVVLSATDGSGTVISDATPLFGPIDRPPFPNPTPPEVPTDIGVDASFVWDGTPTTLQSDDCLEFKVGAGNFGQGPTPVGSGQTVVTRWKTGANCSGASNGTEIFGCLFDPNFSSCGSLIIDRVPNPFSFASQTGIPVNTQVVSNTVSLTGFNAPAFVTVNSTDATGIEGSVNGGSNWSAIPASGETFSVAPGQTLTVRFTTGPSISTEYFVSLNVGQGSTFINPLPTFTVETGGVPFPQTTINFPTTTTTPATSTWQDGNITLNSTGCIEISTNGTSYVTSNLSIGNGQTLFTRWKAGTGCAGEVTGVEITGTVAGGAFSTPGSLVIDRRPAAFTIDSVTGVVPGTQQQSTSVINFTGINAPTFITYTAGSPNSGTNVEGSTNGTSWNPIPLSGTTFSVDPGGSLRVRMTSGPNFTTTYSATINAGDSTGATSAVFDIVTGTPGFPTTHVVFPTATSGTGSVGVTANWQNGAQTLTGTGCIEISLDGNTFGSSVNISDGNTLYTRWISSPTCGEATNGTEITGGVSDGSITESGSLVIDRVPAANSFSFPASTNQFPSSTIFSASRTPTGINATSYVTAAAGGTISNLRASIGGTAFVAIPASGTTLPISPGQSIQLRGTSNSGFGQTTSATIEIGIPGNTVSSTWQISTSGTGVVTPAITSPVNDSVDIDPYTLLPGQVVVSSTPYATVGVPDPHESSDWQIYANTFPITSSELTTAAIQVSDTWTQTTNPFTGNINAIAAGAGIVLAGGQSGQVAISTNGGTGWTLITTTFGTTNVNVITYSPRYGFMMGGDGGLAAYSVSGATNTWLSVGLGFGSDPVRDIIWQGGTSIVSTSGQWVAVGDNGRISTSPTGEVWTGRTSNFGTSAVNGVAFGAGKYVAVGQGGKIATSPDGVTWTLRTSGTTNDLTSIAFGDGNFIAVGASGTGLISSDGETWTTKNIAFGSTRANKVIFGGGQFVCVGGTGRTSVSSDGGANWSLRLSGFGGTDTANTIAFNSNPNTYGFLAGGNAGKMPIIRWCGPASRLTLLNGANDGFEVGDVIQGSGGTTGYVATVSNTEMTVVPFSAVWAPNQSISTASSFTVQVVNSVNDTSNLEQYSLEPSLLQWYTYYYSRVRYKAATSGVLSDWSPWSAFQLQATPGWGTLNLSTDASLFTVPDGVGTLTVTAVGASSGTPRGARSVATFDVQSGDQFRVSSHTGGAGTPQGGGAGGPTVSFGLNTGSPNTVANIWIIAGGAGGTGRYNPSGDPTRFDLGQPGLATGGGGGPLTGTPGVGDNDPGGNPNQPYGGGGGGAGWNGGAGQRGPGGGGGSNINIPSPNNARDTSRTADANSGGANINIKWI